MKYVTSFGDYIGTVTESLLLKLRYFLNDARFRRIVEMETRLAIYDNGTIKRIGSQNLAAEQLLAELNETLILAQTNLTLFRQLGPEVTNLANTYDQLLTQISLVTDDVASLRKGSHSKVY